MKILILNSLYDLRQGNYIWSSTVRSSISGSELSRIGGKTRPNGHHTRRGIAQQRRLLLLRGLRSLLRTIHSILRIWTDETRSVAVHVALLLSSWTAHHWSVWSHVAAAAASLLRPRQWQAGWHRPVTVHSTAVAEVSSIALVFFVILVNFLLAFVYQYYHTRRK